MANIAEHALGMRHDIHLGKSFGFGRVLGVAAPAQIGDVGQLGHVGDGVVHVFGQRAVAGLASNGGMLSTVVRLGLLLMTNGALTSARIGNGARGNHVERSPSVVPEFSKVLRHHGSANDQKNNHSR